MGVRFRFGCAYTFLIFLTFHLPASSYSCVNLDNDLSSNEKKPIDETRKEFLRTTRQDVSSIDDEIHRRTNEQINAVHNERNLVKSDSRPERRTNHKTSSFVRSNYVAIQLHDRKKRDVASNGIKSMREEKVRSNREKRSIGSKKSDERISSKLARDSSREFRRRIDDKGSADYKDLSSVRSSRQLKGASNYAEETQEKDEQEAKDKEDEDEGNGEGEEGEEVESPRAKKDEYKRKSNFRGTMNEPERFIDQEERSSLYDDFESKDIVKRGISGAEDYEEADEEDEPSGTLEDTAAAHQDPDFTNGENEITKVHGDTRVKRDRSIKIKRENHLEKNELARNTDVLSRESKRESNEESTNVRDAKPETRVNAKDEATVKDKVDNKEERDAISSEGQEKDSKVSSLQETDISKQFPGADQKVEGENLKSLNEEIPKIEQNEKYKDVDLLNDKKVLIDLANPSEVSKLETKNLENSDSKDASKIQESINGKDTPITDEAAKIVESKSSDVPAKDAQSDEDYEKRVEEQIQRKIDRIKEEIKREIEERQRVKEIEENNSKFDELRNLDDEDEEDEDGLDNEESEKVQNIAKRSSVNENVKRPTSRKKRQNKLNSAQNENVAVPVNGDRNARLNHENIRKRSAPGYEATNEGRISSAPSPIKKREYVRQVILVKNDQGGGRKRRRKRRKRRSRNVALPSEQTKVNKRSTADLTVDSSLRKVLGDGKAGSSSMFAEEEKNEAEQSAPVDRKSDSVASLTKGSEELSPRLASDYKEAFGGLQGEPGVALARFKRIKRVLPS